MLSMWMESAAARGPFSDSPFRGGGGGITSSSPGRSNRPTEETEPRESVLTSLVQSYEWANVLARVASHPSETRITGVEGRTPLHMACEHDAPAVVIQSLLKACPEASIMIGCSGMTPLHITCSSHNASIHVIRVLLDQGRREQCQIRDLDGDTPLHTACRCGAPLEVLECLLQAYPDAVHHRDNEGLTPLLRLWVRYHVILGERAIDEVQSAADLTGELGEAWQKTEALLRCAYYCSGSAGGSGHNGCSASLSRSLSHASLTGPSSAPELPNNSDNNDVPHRILHAAGQFDCPRAVVKIACLLYPHQLEEMDDEGRTPLMLAAQAPVFKLRDLSDEGFTLLEDVVYGNETSDEPTSSSSLSESHNNRNNDNDQEEFGAAGSAHPSVIEIVLQASLEHGYFSALWPDKHGQLPLHAALQSGKKWNEGVKELVEAYPEALGVQHPPTKLFPFLLAAEDDPDNLDTVYHLLRHSPSLMSEILSKQRKGSNNARKGES